MYDISTVPPFIPVIIPVVPPAEAMVMSPLLQVPPAVASVSAVVRPTHMVSGLPVGIAGVVDTETIVVPIQPDGGK